MQKQAETFTVVYRTGGTENCVWKRSLTVVKSVEAIAIKESLERAGYKALIHKTSQLDKLGMPIGWEA